MALFRKAASDSELLLPKADKPQLSIQTSVRGKWCLPLEKARGIQLMAPPWFSAVLWTCPGKWRKSNVFGEQFHLLREFGWSYKNLTELKYWAKNKWWDEDIMILLSMCCTLSYGWDRYLKALAFKLLQQFKIYFHPNYWELDIPIQFPAWNTRSCGIYMYWSR